MLAELSIAELVLFVFGVTLGATALGAFFGHRVRHLSETLSEPFGILQGALLGLVGLILAFGLSLALSRYEDRRAAVVHESNTIGTTYLRAQTLPEPFRGDSLALLDEYTRSAIRLSEYAPSSAEEDEVTEHEAKLQRQLWREAGAALAASPTLAAATASRLYVETLNDTIDAQNSRVAALNNQVPGAVFLLEVLGAAIAMALLSAYLAVIGRGLAGAAMAAVLVAALLFVTADLDRPTTGLITVPDTVLTDLEESIQLPPASGPPGPGDGRPAGKG